MLYTLPSCAVPYRAVPRSRHLPGAALPQLLLRKPHARALGRALPPPSEAHACFGVLPAAWWGPRGGVSPRCPCWCAWQLLLSAEPCREQGLLYPAVPLGESLGGP